MLTIFKTKQTDVSKSDFFYNNVKILKLISGEIFDTLKNIKLWILKKKFFFYLILHFLVHLVNFFLRQP